MLDRTESETPRVATGMISIPGGTLRRGSDKNYAEEAPVRTTKPMCRRRAASRESRAAAGTTRATIPVFPTSKSAQGDQGRLASVRAGLLPPLSTRRAHAEPVDTSASYLGFCCVVRNSGGMTPRTPSRAEEET
jgi:hypothetical protein